MKWKLFYFSLLPDGLSASYKVDLKDKKQPVEFLNDNMWMCLFDLILLITISQLCL